ncbi:MAG: hypothetical protein ABIO72_03400 [Patescibacteria group bacterium]
MPPPDPDLVYDELRFHGPLSTPTESTAPTNPKSKRDWLDLIEDFERYPLTSRPVFFDGSEEDSITPHTTSDDL